MCSCKEMWPEPKSAHFIIPLIMVPILSSCTRHNALELLDHPLFLTTPPGFHIGASSDVFHDRLINLVKNLFFFFDRPDEVPVSRWWRYYTLAWMEQSRRSDSWGPGWWGLTAEEENDLHQTTVECSRAFLSNQPVSGYSPPWGASKMSNYPRVKGPGTTTLPQCGTLMGSNVCV